MSIIATRHSSSSVWASLPAGGVKREPGWEHSSFANIFRYVTVVNTYCASELSSLLSNAIKSLFTFTIQMLSAKCVRLCFETLTSDLRPSEHQTIRTSDRQNIRPSDHQIIRTSDHQTVSQLISQLSPSIDSLPRTFLPWCHCPGMWHSCDINDPTQPDPWHAIACSHCMQDILVHCRMVL